MDATQICFMALLCVLIPCHGHIALIQSLKTTDMSAPVGLSRDTCALSDLVKETGGYISYCDNTDGSTVPNSYWCDVTSQEESGHNKRLTYQCEEGVWRIEVGTGIYLEKGSVRNKRKSGTTRINNVNAFFQMGSSVATIASSLTSIVCSFKTCIPQKGYYPESRPAPPKFETCPPVEINANTIYQAPQGHNSAIVVWTEPKSTGTEVTSSLSCCGNHKSGDSFPGSVAGTYYFKTYIATDKYGQKDVCSFEFRVFYLACEEPSPSPTRIKQECTHGLLYGSECTFGCIEGYSITNGSSNKSMCGNTAKWSTLPECEKTRCTPPVAPTNGNVSCRSPQYAYDTECIFSCNDGYRLSGPSTVYCQSVGSWSTADVKCTDDEPPVITCSHHVFYAESGMTSAQVQWTDPVVTDNVDNGLIAKKLSDISQGDVLEEGTYTIHYRAIDSAGNTFPLLSDCNVTIQVLIAKCVSGPADSLSDTRFLRYNCTDSVYYSGVKCNLFCDLNLNLNGTDMMFCERNGTSGVAVWKWTGEVEPHCHVVECPPLTPPARGAIAKNSIEGKPSHVMLCQSPYDSPVVGANFFGRLNCQDSGQWYPLEKFPDCIESEWGDLVLPAELIYTGDCQKSDTQEVIKRNVLAYLSKIEDDVEQSICPGKYCKVENINVTCDPPRKRRSFKIIHGHDIIKRQTVDVRVRLEFSIPFILSNTNSSEAKNALLPFLTAFSNRVRADFDNGTLDIDGFTRVEFLPSEKTNFRCPHNLKKDGFVCKPCPKGTYMNSTTRNCELCNIGEYNEEDGRSQCDLCPPDHSTLKTGSTHPSECTRYCDPGFASSTGMVPCFSCPLGTYQVHKSATTCMLCPVGHTTQSTSSTNLKQCTLFDLKVDNLHGSQLVGTFKNDVNTSILTLSLYARKDTDNSEDLTLAIRDETSDVLLVLLGNSNTTIKIGNTSFFSKYNLSTKRWAHLLIELDCSSYSLNVYEDAEQGIHQTVPPCESIQSGTVHMATNADTGITLSGLALYPRNLTTEEWTSLNSTCHLNSTGALLSMDDLVRKQLEGLASVSPTSCDPIDECIDSPCGIHTCKSEIETFTCVCSGGWSGSRCDVAPDYCLNHDCKHGTCVPGSGTYTCNCIDFYSGSDCSTPPVNGGWSSWSEWSRCDVTCGGGTQTHTRRCVEPERGPGGLNCTGSNEEKQPCNNKKCPECKKLKRAFGTQVVCYDETDSGDIRCNVSCSAGLIFPSGQEPYPQYTCGRSTGYEWIPFAQVTECMEYSPPTELGYGTYVNLNVQVPTKDTAIVEQAFLKQLQTLPCVVENKCSGNASITNTNERRKRSAGSSIVISFLVQVPELNNLDIAGFIENETVSSDLQRLREAYIVVNDSTTYLLHNSENIFSVTISGVQYNADLASMYSLLVVFCKPGFSGADGMCVECPRGTHEVNAVCWSCDVGTYQSFSGQTTCEPCPTGYTTATFMATSIEECNVLVTRRPELMITEPTGDDKHVVVITVVVISVLVVVVAIVIGVLCYKKTRKQSRTSRSRSLASMNIIYPKVAGSIEQHTMMPQKAEQANARFTRDASFGCHSTPPPYSF